MKKHIKTLLPPNSAETHTLTELSREELKTLCPGIISAEKIPADDNGNFIFTPIESINGYKATVK